MGGGGSDYIPWTGVPCVPLYVPVLPTARVLVRQMKAKERMMIQARTDRWKDGDTGDSWLDGARPDDIIGSKSPLEEQFFRSIADARREDPEGSFAYLPAVEKTHRTVHESFRDDPTCPGASWFFGMIVSQGALSRSHNRLCGNRTPIPVRAPAPLYALTSAKQSQRSLPEDGA
jgi:hypothetical protein